MIHQLMKPSRIRFKSLFRVAGPFLFMLCLNTLAPGCARPGQAREKATARGHSGPCLTGCFVTAPGDLYRQVRLCLGSPSAPAGSFVLEDRQQVPDALLTRTYRGACEVRGAALVLSVTRRASRDVDEQLGQASSSGPGPASFTLHGTIDGPNLRLEPSPGVFEGPVVILRSR